MNTETILTMHPDRAKQGVKISKARYDLMRAAILEQLAAHGEATFSELSELVENSLAGRFDGSVMWYFTTVKLDLEARGELQRIPGANPQIIRLAATA